MYPHDTIAAVATPHGYGGIGIIRLSGAGSLAVLSTMFRTPVGEALPSFIPRMLHHGWVYSVASSERPAEALDEVLAVFMPGPGTFTGEDVAEIHCHGGPAIVSAVLEACLAAGARAAVRGEFTYRAFMHGKMDLTQAEAVAEMIHAPSRHGVRLAQAKLAGLLGARISALKTLVDELRARIALAVDFPDDEQESFDAAFFLDAMCTLMTELRTLLASYARARLWQEGAMVALLGQVNAGKSSMLNALLGRTRAIVSPIAGTTRDFIEETINLDGLHLRVIDTAGLRESTDAIEQEGISLSHDMAEQADCIILMIDSRHGIHDTERELLQRYAHKCIVAFNKIDLLPDAGCTRLTTNGICPQVTVSAKDGTGLETLCVRIRERILHGQGAEPHDGDIAPNLRQSRLLEQALAEAQAVCDDLHVHIPVDLIGVRLDAIAVTLAEITGYSDADDILGTIFSQFCIGK